MATGSINISSNISRSTLLESFPPSEPAAKFRAISINNSIELMWEDPDDYTLADSTTIKWSYTRIVRKTGSYPINECDGTVIIESSVKNQYKTTPFVDTGLTNGTEYYYAAFTCNTYGVFNRKPIHTSGTPIQYRIMTVNINLKNSNPSTCGSYADNANEMHGGKSASEWKDFFGYKPCLFKNGTVVGYLNPDDYTKFEDGSSADITSGNAGDVMIQFPRRGLKISKANNILTVSMTDNPNDTNFTYYAHQRGSTNKDYFYIGAYLAYSNITSVRSLSGKSPFTNSSPYSLSYMYGVAVKSGTGYGLMSFYQYVFIQAMYILQYRGNCDSQRQHGKGMCGGASHNTGSGDQSGVMFGDTSKEGKPLKLFGIEDLWGNLEQILNGITITYPNCDIYTTTDDRITDMSKYENIGRCGSADGFNGYMNECVGNNKFGFLPIYNGTKGSGSTYFCDRVNINCDYSTAGFLIGGFWSAADEYGIFYCKVEDQYIETGEGIRLQYL